MQAAWRLFFLMKKKFYGKQPQIRGQNGFILEKNVILRII